MAFSISGFMNWFIPEKYYSDTRIYGRCKIIIGIGLVVGTVIMLQSIRSFFIQYNPTLGVAIVTFSLFVMSAPFVLKFTKSTVISGNMIVLALTILASMVVLNRGGITCAIASYFAMITISAFITLSKRGGYAWGFISLLVVIAIYSVKKMGIEFPVHRISPEGLEIYALLSYAVLVIFAMILGGIFENISISNMDRYLVSQKESQKIADQLQLLFDDVAEVMSSVSKSDLSRRITFEAEGKLGEMKMSVNEAIELLSATIQQVSNSSQSILKGAEDLSGTALSLSDGSSTQAASIQQISSSMTEIDNLSKRNNQGAIQSKELTEKTLNIVMRGNKQMEEMVGTMNQISSTGQNVTKVIKTIDEIAFQTNLLALNAAVEAARAGKYGKGFSVVAEEVRSLAARSAEAAKETNNLIESTMGEINKGVEKVSVTADFLNEIMSSVEKISGIINEIVLGSGEQRSSIEEITKSIELVNTIVQQTSSISENTASSSSALKAQSIELQGTMASFRLST